MPASILVLDDEHILRNLLENALHSEGYDTLPAASVAEAMELIQTRHIDCALIDQNLPDGNGLMVLAALKSVDADLPVIMLTGYGSVDSVKTALRQGVYDYLTKPPDLTQLRAVLHKALENLELRREIRRLRSEQLATDSNVILGTSNAMGEIERVIQRVAPTTASVLIQGESGTGKEVMALILHRNSPRESRPFIAINCAAIPEQLLESELFGYEAGAFTGAKRQKKGLIELADQGTLFLDEIGSMPLNMQAKLLRVLETRQIRRLGGTQDIRVDIRLIAATNRDLRVAIESAAFREDLFWRLSVVEIHLPPLRERAEDIDLFVAQFVASFARDAGKDVHGVSPAAMEALRSHRWPGNIRELRNVIERAIILCDGPEIKTNHLPSEIVAEQQAPVLSVGRAVPTLPPDGLDLKRTVGEMEQRLVEQAMERTGGNQTLAAHLLSLSRDELRYRLNKYKKDSGDSG
ncbi:MAG: sigma-54 dependent transcriptional regulator [Anaerolineae bacterium]